VAGFHENESASGHRGAIDKPLLGDSREWGSG